MGNVTSGTQATTTDIAEAANLYFTNGRAQAAITGGASSIVTANLAVSRALASDASGKVSAATTTLTELNYLTGVTSNVQSQFSTLTTNLATTNSNVAAATGSIALTNSNVATITGQIVTINSNIATATGNIATLTTNLATTNSNVATATGNITTLSGRVNTLSGVVDLKANIASPTFTGVPAAPTPATSDNSTTLATTAYVKANLSTAVLSGTVWTLAGNTAGVSDFLGTTNAADLVFRTNNTDRLRLTSAGKLVFTG